MAASGLLLQPSSPEDFRAAASRHGLDTVPRGKKPIRIFLELMGAEKTAVPTEVLGSDTIASLKVRKNLQEGAFTTQERLVCGGREVMEADSFIKDNGLANRKVLRVVLRASDLVDIAVRTVTGVKHVLRVQRRARSVDLKDCISSRQDGLALEEHRLTLRGKGLTDRTVIQDLPLRDFVLHLYLQQPIKLLTKRVGGEFELSVNAVELFRFDTLIDCIEKFSLEKVPRDERRKSIERGLTANETRRVWQAAFSEEVIHHHGSVEPARHCQRFEFPDILKDLLEQVRAGLQAARLPSLSSEGSGGVYFMKDEYGLENVAVFKPTDEEPMAVNNPRGFSSFNCGEGLKRGTRVGAGAAREVAAYLLDHPLNGPRGWKGKYQDGFAGVPPTIMVRCYHEAFHWNAQDQSLYRQAKLGSLQQFVRAFSSCEDMGTSSFPVEEVHKITVLDLRLANADRNGGNILVCKGEEQSVKLVPIDHGYCLPEKFEDCTFEWLYWPQARHPYGSAIVKYISSLDAEQDIKLLQQCGLNLRPQSARILRVATMVLKKGAAARLTPFHIGSIISRQFPDLKSPIEVLLEKAEFKKPPASDEADFLQVLAGLVDEYIATIKHL